MFTKEQRSTFPYWFAHWCAFQMTALNLGVWKFKYLFHDIEKPFLRLFLPYKKVQEIHRKNHNHHLEWLEKKLQKYDVHRSYDNLLERYDFEATIIDWECSRFTKEAAQLNANEEFKRLISSGEFEKKYPKLYSFSPFKFKFEESLFSLNLISVEEKEEWNRKNNSKN